MVVACSTGNVGRGRTLIYLSSAYHQILKGNSKRVIRMPWSNFRARSPSACFPEKGAKRVSKKGNWKVWVQTAHHEPCSNSLEKDHNREDNIWDMLSRKVGEMQVNNV